MRRILAVREALVRARAGWISRIQPLLRREGLRVRSGNAETFVTRVEELSLPDPLRAALAPLLTLFGPVNERITALDETLAEIVVTDDVTRRLTTVPGVGPVTAVAFVSTLDDVTRFPGAHQVESYLGLVPCFGGVGDASERRAFGTHVRPGLQVPAPAPVVL